MRTGTRDDLSWPTTALIAIWIVAVCALQWIMYGPHVDLDALTGLHLASALKDLSVQLREFFSPPLGS